MNNSARKVLKSMTQYILENFILNDGILDCLEDNKILTDELIQHIKAEKTENQKIRKLLHILKKRGPTAFEHFVAAIRPDFSFVSEILEKEYANELENANNNDASSPEASNHEPRRHSSEESMSIDQTESEILPITQTSSIGTQTNDIERRGNSDFMQRMMQESFRCWYTKIKSHMTRRNLRELSFRSPEPITYDMVDQLIDELIEIIEGCHRTLNIRDNLKTHVIELKESIRKKDEELKEKDQMRDKYHDFTNKLETKCRDISAKLEEEKSISQNLHADLTCLKVKLEAEIKEKEELKQKLENALSKTNEGNVRHQKIQKCKKERKNFREIVDSSESETERKELTGPRAWHRSERSRSREDYQQRRHIAYFKSPARMDTNHSYKSSDSSKQIRKMQHNNGRQSKELTAVEEPDRVCLARTQSFVESNKNERTIPLEKHQKDQSQSSDKENNDDCQNGETHQNVTDGNFKQEQQILMVSNSSSTSNTLLEQTESSQSKQTIGRKTPHTIKSRRKNSVRQRVWFGTNENNEETVQKAARNAPTEVKNLSSLVIVNNTKCPQQESPRGAKVMKQH